MNLENAIIYVLVPGLVMWMLLLRIFGVADLSWTTIFSPVWILILLIGTLVLLSKIIGDL